jgi:hypothetical protein
MATELLTAEQQGDKVVNVINVGTELLADAAFFLERSSCNCGKCLEIRGDHAKKIREFLK